MRARRSWRAPRSPTSRRAAGGRSSSAAPACTCARSSTTSRSRRRPRPRAPRSSARRRPRGRRAGIRPAARGRPRRRDAHGAEQPAAHRARARGDRHDRPAVLVVRPRHRRRTTRPRSTSASSGSGSSRPVLNDRIEARFAAMRAGGLVDEVRALAAGGRPAVADRARRRSATAKCSRTCEASSRSLDAAFEEAVHRTRRFARRQRMWFRRDPRVEWMRTGGKPQELAPAILATWTGSVPARV